MASIHGSDIAALEPYWVFSTSDTIPILSKGDHSLSDPSGVAKQIPLSTIINAAAQASGTVESVTLTGDGTVLSSAAPALSVTSAGTLTATLATHAANLVLAGPVTGSTGGNFDVCALVAADLPSASTIVARCDHRFLVGAVVKVLDSGGGTLATCTTDITGCCKLDVSTTGTYQLTATATGFIDYRHKITVTTCPQTFSIAMQPTGTSTSTVTFTVFGCCSQLLPNALVTIDGQSGLTDSSGQVSFTITDVGTFPYNVTKSRFSPGSGEITVSSVCGSLDPGNNITLTLSPASGFTCAPLGNNATLADPTTTTLNLTDSQYGAAVVTYDGINSWTGTNTVSTSIGGGGLCPAGPVSVTITYTVSACPSADGSASATWSYHDCGGCFGADCIANGGVMASDSGQVPCPQAGAALCAAGGIGTLNAGTSTETSVISPSVPLNLVVTFTAPASTALQLYSGTVTFTITE